MSIELTPVQLREQVDDGTLANIGKTILINALETEDQLGIEEAFEGYVSAGEHFATTFGHKDDPVVLLLYSICLARQAQSRKVQPYQHNDVKYPFIQTDILIDRTNMANIKLARDMANGPDHGMVRSVRWSYDRRDNLKAIAVRSSNLSLEIITTLEEAGGLAEDSRELSVAASKLVAAGIEIGNPQAVIGLMQGAVEIAQGSNMSKKVIGELNDYAVNLTPGNSAAMTIEAIEEVEEAFSELPDDLAVTV